MSNRIHFIFTGGTIDGVFNTVQYKPVPAKNSNIPNYLIDYVKFKDFSISQVSAVDGLDMTDEIRLKIVNEIESAQCDKIIITHGTDNLTITAKYIYDHFNGSLNKAVIFMGAMHPLSFIPSDAGFNLGYAVAQSEHLESGIYVCMNGQVFDPLKVKKNQEQSLFEEEK